jgi:hypothetical protein
MCCIDFFFLENVVMTQRTGGSRKESNSVDELLRLVIAKELGIDLGLPVLFFSTPMANKGVLLRKLFA